jgi:hypothetical protein
MSRLPLVESVLAGLLMSGLLGAGSLHAQSSPSFHIGVVTRPNLPSAWSAGVIDALRTNYAVTRLGRSAERRVVPALRSRVVAAEVTLILVLSRQRNMLKLEYLDARNGAQLGRARFFVRGPRLSEKTEDKILAATTRYASLHEADADDVRAQPSVASPQRPTRADDDDAVEGVVSDEFASESESEAEPKAGPDEAESPEEAIGDEPEDLVELTVIASVGSSAYAGELQTEGLSYRFDAGPAFAGGLGARLALGSRVRTHWLLEARYVTSLGREVDELHMAGESQPMGLRTHRLEGGLGPRFLLGHAGWSLTPTLGYALRSVVPEVHFQLIPFYTLGGPYLRLELRTPLFGPRIGLRLSPELQWLPQASTRVGGSRLGAGRFALAGQLTVFVRLSEAIDLEAFIHQSHAWAASSELEVTDMERFVLASIAWRP